jgi:hypothetical protein
MRSNTDSWTTRKLAGEITQVTRQEESLYIYNAGFWTRKKFAVQITQFAGQEESMRDK